VYIPHHGNGYENVAGATCLTRRGRNVENQINTTIQDGGRLCIVPATKDPAFEVVTNIWSQEMCWKP
jgi:hypothetical protein